MEIKDRSKISPSKLRTLRARAEKFLNSDTVASQVTSATLALVIITATLSTICVAPGLTVVARQYKRFKYYSNKQIRDANTNLKRRGYIEETSHDGNSRVRLTKKGETYFHKMIFEDECFTAQENWDGTWRFLVFDIPTKYTKAREALRWRIKTLGFFQYQKSVWVYPYPCKDELLYLAGQYGVEKYVEVIEATRLSNEDFLKKHFGLS